MTEFPVETRTEVPPHPEVPSRLHRRFDAARAVAVGGQALLVWFSLLVVFGGHRPLTHGGILTITVAAAIWIVALRCAVLPGPVVLGRAIAGAVGTAVGLVVVTTLNSAVGPDVPFSLLAGAGLAVLASVTCWGWFVEGTLATTRRVLLVGADGLGDLLEDELRASRHARYEVVGAIAGADELAEIVRAQQPDIVVLTDETTYGEALERLLDARANVRVAGLPSFFEYALGRVPIERITPAWFMSLLHPRQRVYTRLGKRSFDVVVATSLLVLSAPVIALIALAAKVGGGPILYRQTRLGEGGKRFTILKFRTMRCDAEAHGAAFACANDPRATRLGRFLRRTHLDELPQLWNVLKGDMSIVGPRPERPEFIGTIEAAVPFWNRRLLVKPGITGWAQVRCDYADALDDMKTKLSYDLWYLRHGSMLVDLAVCVLTVCTLAGRPARQ